MKALLTLLVLVSASAAWALPENLVLVGSNQWRRNTDVQVNFQLSKTKESQSKATYKGLMTTSDGKSTSVGVVIDKKSGGNLIISGRTVAARSVSFQSERISEANLSGGPINFVTRLEYVIRDCFDRREINCAPVVEVIDRGSMTLSAR